MVSGILPEVHATAVVNSATGNACAAVSSCTVSVTASSTGDLLALAIATVDTNGRTISTVAGTHSSGWAAVGSAAVACSTERAWIYYTTSTSTSADTITVTLSGVSSNKLTLLVLDVSGIPVTLDGSEQTGVSDCSTMTSPATGSGSFTTGDFLFTSLSTPGTGGTMAPGTGFTCGAANADCNIGNFLGGQWSVSGVTSPTTYPYSTGSTLTHWSEVGIAFGPAVLTQTIACTMDNSATQATLSLSGGSISPSTVLCDAGSHTFTCTASSTLTATEPADGGNTRDRFAGGGTTTTHTCAADTWTITNYEQLDNTYGMTPVTPSTWDATYSKTATGTVAGTGSTTVCTLTLSSGGGAATCTGWADYNRAVSVPPSFASSVSGTWTASNSNSFSDTTGGNTHNTNYNLLAVSRTITCTMDNSATQATVTLSGGSISPTTVLCDGGGHTFTVNAGATVTATEPSDAANTRDRFTAGVLFITTTSFPWSFTNYEQLNNIYSCDPLGPSGWDAIYACTATGTVVGTGSTQICTTNTIAGQSAVSCSGWADYNRAVSTPANLGLWLPSPGSPNTFTQTTGGNTNEVDYFLSFVNTYTATPIAAGSNVFDSGFSIVVNGTLGGVPSQTICTITTVMGSGAQSCSGASDTGFPVNYLNTNQSDGANKRWLALAPTSFTDSSAGNTHNVNYYLQLKSTYVATPIVHTVNHWDGVYLVLVTGNSLGTTNTQCAIATSNGGGEVSCAKYIDYNTAVTFATITVSANQRWFPNQSSFTTTTPKELTSGYYDQIFNTYEATPVSPPFWDGVYSIPATGTYIGTGSTAICNIPTHIGGGIAPCSGWSDKNLSVSEASFGVWIAQAPTSFTDDPGGNTHNVNFIQNQVTTTVTVIGWNAPSGIMYGNGIVAFLFSLVGMAAFGTFPAIVKYRGDFTVTLMLAGAVLGLMVATLPANGASNNLVVPIGVIAVGAFFEILWLWKGATGGH